MNGLRKKDWRPSIAAALIAIGIVVAITIWLAQ